MSSDEIKEVPNVPLVLNALCNLLKAELRIPAERELSLEEQESATQFESSKCEIANTIAAIASEGVKEIQEQEETLEDRMLHGSASSPIKRLYQQGTRNLIAIANSEVPETLVGLMASGTSTNDLLISVIECIGATALYIKVAERYASLGVMKDLVRIFEESPDFRAYAVSIALDAIWNLVEVVG